MQRLVLDSVSAIVQQIQFLKLFLKVCHSGGNIMKLSYSLLVCCKPFYRKRILTLFDQSYL